MFSPIRQMLNTFFDCDCPQDMFMGNVTTADTGKAPDLFVFAVHVDASDQSLRASSCRVR
jgi:hypothetical protein